MIFLIIFLVEVHNFDQNLSMDKFPVLAFDIESWIVYMLS